MVEIFTAPHGTIKPQSSQPKCHHFETYGMTCEEANALWTRAECRCEICGVLDVDAPFGLFIDHDAYAGYNAVRGLLCTRCNKRIDDPRGWPWPQDFAYNAAHYLANAWYLRPGSITVVRRNKPVGRDFKFGTRHGERVMHSLPGWRYGRNIADCGVTLMYRFESGELDGYVPCRACASRRQQRTG